MFDKGELEALLRETVREVVAEELQALLFLEREAFIQENGGRVDGTYPRTLETPFGQVQLRVPRDRQGRFKPSLFAPYARRTVDLADLVLVLYAVGVSARVVGEVMGHLLGHRYSHSTVSRITELVLERVEAFRTRPLRKRYAIVYLDCLFVKVLREGGIRKEAVYVVLGIDPQGRREVLGFYLFPTSRRLCGRRSFGTCGSEGCGRYWCL
jgi:transposase-like protein